MTENADPKVTAAKLAQFVKDYGLDGVDIDFEGEPVLGFFHPQWY